MKIQFFQEGVLVLTSDKKDCRAYKIIKDKEGYYMMVKESKKISNSKCVYTKQQSFKIPEAKTHKILKRNKQNVNYNQGFQKFITQLDIHTHKSARMENLITPSTNRTSQTFIEYSTQKQYYTHSFKMCGFQIFSPSPYLQYFYPLNISYLCSYANLYIG